MPSLRRRQVFGADHGLLQAGYVALKLVALLDDQLEKRGSADERVDTEVAYRRYLHLGLADAGRHHGAAERQRPRLEHRAGGRKVVSEGVDHQVAGTKAAGVKAARGAPPVLALSLRIVNRSRRDEDLAQPLARRGIEPAERRYLLLQLAEIGFARHRQAG
jgi:hypothetical protein